MSDMALPFQSSRKAKGFSALVSISFLFSSGYLLKRRSHSVFVFQQFVASQARGQQPLALDLNSARLRHAQFQVADGLMRSDFDYR